MKPGTKNSMMNMLQGLVFQTMHAAQNQPSSPAGAQSSIPEVKGLPHILQAPVSTNSVPPIKPSGQQPVPMGNNSPFNTTSGLPASMYQPKYKTGSFLKPNTNMWAGAANFHSMFNPKTGSGAPNTSTVRNPITGDGGGRDNDGSNGNVGTGSPFGSQELELSNGALAFIGAINPLAALSIKEYMYQNNKALAAALAEEDASAAELATMQASGIDTTTIPQTVLDPFSDGDKGGSGSSDTSGFGGALGESVTSGGQGSVGNEGPGQGGFGAGLGGGGDHDGNDRGNDGGGFGGGGNPHR